MRQIQTLMDARTRYRNPCRSIWKARLGETLGDLVDGRRIAERQPRHVLGDGVLRVDLLQLGPDLSGFVELAKMAERRSERAAAHISLRRQPDPLPEMCSRLLIVAESDRRNQENAGIDWSRRGRAV